MRRFLALMACSCSGPTPTTTPPDGSTDGWVVVDSAGDAAFVGDTADSTTDAGGLSGPCAPSTWPGDAVIVDATKYGAISLASVSQAVADASNYLGSNPSTTYVVQFGSGVFDLSASTAGNGLFDVTGISPMGGGRLVLAGAGSNATTFVLNDQETATYGHGASHVCFVGMHLTWSSYTVTQGHVTADGHRHAGHSVRLSDAHGHLRPDRHAGRYLREYTDSATDPQLIDQDGGSNGQIPWDTATQVSGSQWSFAVKPANQVPPYAMNALIGVKSKHGADAGFFNGGSDIVFNDILWTQRSRTVFRSGASGVQIWNSSVARSAPINGQTPCLSTPGGGPQIGQPTDAPTTDDVVVNYTADSTGDDSLAFFNTSTGSSVSTSTLSNSFSERCILLANSAAVTVDSSTQSAMSNCHIVSN